MKGICVRCGKSQMVYYVVNKCTMMMMMMGWIVGGEGHFANGVICGSMSIVGMNALRVKKNAKE